MHKIIFFLIGCVIALQSSAQVKADFAALVPQTCAPVAVRFSDSSNGSPTSWLWEFGNGDTSHAKSPVYIYKIAGAYEVKLTASNSSSSNTIQKQIVVIGSVKAAFTYQYDNVCTAPSHFTFSAINPQDTLSYLWKFGNGKIASNSTSPATFTSTGNYPVQLITTTPQGCKDTAYKTFSIGGAKAGFSSFSVVCKNAPAVFTDTSFPIPLSQNWYVNGAAAGNGSVLTYTFTANGKYTVKLVAGFGSCTQTVEKTIEVKDRPTAAFSTTGSLQSCTVPANIQFTNSSSNADTYKWIYSDGNTSTAVSPNYTYQKTGTFSPSLIAFTGDGCSDTTTKSNLVRLGPPVVNSFTGLPKSGCIPVAAESDASITSPDPVTSYQWNTGDNNIMINGSHFSHTYTNEKYYDVSLTVTTQNGCTGTYTLKQAVAAGTKPVTDFTVDQPTVCASVPVNFIDKSVGPVTSWNWNFGDGLSTSGKNPSHLFTKIGSNDVTLYISNKGCAGDPKTIKNIVSVLPPIADFAFSYTCASQLAVQFTDKSQQPVSWEWKFDDGQTATSQNPFHTYASSGNYQVILKATNGSCTSSDTAVVSVNSEKPSIVMQPSKIFFCRNDSITLSAVSSSGFVTSYSWNAGDGSAMVSDSTITHVYKISNDYKPYVAVQYANKCRDTIYTTELVHVYGPTAAFTSLQSGNCLPLTVTFTDNSTNDNFHSIDNRKWYYGNGESADINTSKHTYTYQSGGSFLPKLIVTDAVGCIDSVSASQSTIAKGIVVSFTYKAEAACDSSVVSFTNTSLSSNDVVAAYTWNFDDNTTSFLSNPVHVYRKSGSYKTTLTVTTQSGCSSSATQTVNINISPKQTVTINAPNNACVSSDVPFSASLSGNDPVSLWTWQTGNGVIKNGETVTANYKDAKSYTIQAIATTAGGCADTGYKKIDISDLPNTNAGSDGFVCAGSSISLSATGADTYLWQQVNNELSCTNCASPVVSPVSPVSYVVTGKNIAGCVSNDTMFINVQSKETVAVAKYAFGICEGETIQLSASGTDEYNWQPATDISNTSVSNPTASPTANITYQLKGTDKHHCFTDTKQVAVTVDKAPQFSILDSVLTLPRGVKHTLTTLYSNDVVHWSWEPATGLSCSNCGAPELTAVLSGTYKATAYTTNGCSSSDEITIVLLCDQSGIFIPTAFTPNNDGRNDRFYPKSFADSKVLHFIIASRNGNIVYRRDNILTNSFADGWDGIYNSQMLPPGTYTYKLEVECDKNIIPFTGTVTLIR